MMRDIRDCGVGKLHKLTSEIINNRPQGVNNNPERDLQLKKQLTQTVVEIYNKLQQG